MLPMTSRIFLCHILWISPVDGRGIGFSPACGPPVPKNDTLQFSGFSDTYDTTSMFAAQGFDAGEALGCRGHRQIGDVDIDGVSRKLRSN